MKTIQEQIEYKNKILNKLINYKQLLFSLVSKKDFTFIVGKDKIKIKYDDFTEGYDQFIEIFSDYVDDFIKEIED